MTPREEHLSEMLEQALALVDRERARAQDASVTAAALQAVEARLARIEAVLHGASPEPEPAPAPAPRRKVRVTQLPACEARIVRILTERGALSATDVTKSVYDTARPTEREVSHVWRSLARLARSGVLVRGLGKTYSVSDPATVTE